MQSHRTLSAFRAMLLSINFVLLASCTTVQVMDGGTVKVERFFGMPMVQVTAGDSSIVAVRLHGVGVMVSDSNVLIGYADEFSIRKDLTRDNCSMVVLVDSNEDAANLLKEIKANREVYSDICTVNINAEKGTTND